MRLAGFLMMKGFVCLDIKLDKKCKRNIYIFNESDELKKMVREYSEMKSNNTLPITADK